MRLLPRSTLIGLSLAAALGCGDTGGPSLSGDDFLSGSVNGTAFTADTSQATFYPSGADGGSLAALAISLDRTDRRKAIVLVIRRPPGVGHILLGTLGDSGVAGAAAWEISYDHGPFVDSTVGYQKLSHDPGMIRLTGHDPAAQVIAGTFSFTAYGDSTHSSPRHIAGRFRLHYGIVFAQRAVEAWRRVPGAAR